jgi:tRNA-specific 2-thiouridylase
VRFARIFATKNYKLRKTDCQIDKEDAVYNIQNNADLTEQEQLIRSSKKLHIQPIWARTGKHQNTLFPELASAKGLNVGGTKDPLFIIATDVDTNTIYTGLVVIILDCLENRFYCCWVHWFVMIYEVKNGQKMDAMVRIRYRQPLQKAVYINMKMVCTLFLKSYSRQLQRQFCCMGMR